jgi:hypothetical protein
VVAIHLADVLADVARGFASRVDRRVARRVRPHYAAVLAGVAAALEERGLGRAAAPDHAEDDRTHEEESKSSKGVHGLSPLAEELRRLRGTS